MTLICADVTILSENNVGVDNADNEAWKIAPHCILVGVTGFTFIVLFLFGGDDNAKLDTRKHFRNYKGEIQTMAGRNWTRKSIEELVDSYLSTKGGGKLETFPLAPVFAANPVISSGSFTWTLTIVPDYEDKTGKTQYIGPWWFPSVYKINDKIIKCIRILSSIASSVISVEGSVWRTGNGLAPVLSEFKGRYTFDYFKEYYALRNSGRYVYVLFRNVEDTQTYTLVKINGFSGIPFYTQTVGSSYYAVADAEASLSVVESLDSLINTMKSGYDSIEVVYFSSIEYGVEEIAPLFSPDGHSGIIITKTLEVTL